MNRTQAETLRELRVWLKFDTQYDGWARPLDIGGSNGSHHSNTLRRMIGLGWVESKSRSVFAGRGSYRYRITTKGDEALANHDASVELARLAVIAAGERAKARG